jgi:hypothetical protein
MKVLPLLLLASSIPTLTLQLKSLHSPWELQSQRCVDACLQSCGWTVGICAGYRMRWHLLKRWCVQKWGKVCDRRLQNKSIRIIISCSQVTSHGCFMPVVIEWGGSLLGMMMSMKLSDCHISIRKLCSRSSSMTRANTKLRLYQRDKMKSTYFIECVLCLLTEIYCPQDTWNESHAPFCQCTGS